MYEHEFVALNPSTWMQPVPAYAPSLRAPQCLSGCILNNLPNLLIFHFKLRDALDVSFAAEAHAYWNLYHQIRQDVSKAASRCKFLFAATFLPIDVSLALA